MERTEKTGLGLAIAGHVVLFGLLSVGFLATPNPLKLQNTPMEVTLATEAAPVAEAQQSVATPSSSHAPELGQPQDSAPPPAEAVPTPQPTAAPPKPVARPQPQPSPAPAPKPQPRQVAKPMPAKPAPPKPEAKPAPAKAAAKPSAKPAPAAAKPQPRHGNGLGSIMASIHPRATGSKLGADFLKDISSTPNASTTQQSRAAKVGARELASIAGLIKRQVQPCYDLGSLGGTSAMDIVTVLRLQFRPDGSVSAATVSEQQGVNDDNRSYAKQMAELSRRAVLRCSPLRGLPPELYKGGWEDIDMGFIPRQLG